MLFYETYNFCILVYFVAFKPLFLWGQSRSEQLSGCVAVFFGVLYLGGCIVYDGFLYNGRPRDNRCFGNFPYNDRIGLDAYDSPRFDGYGEHYCSVFNGHIFDGTEQHHLESCFASVGGCHATIAVRFLGNGKHHESVGSGEQPTDFHFFDCGYYDGHERCDGIANYCSATIHHDLVWFE